MKKATFIFFLFLLPNLLPAQQVNIDSLWAVWSDETQSDTARLKAIHKYAWNGYIFTQPDSAFYYAQLQYDFAKVKGNKKHMAIALNTQGVSFYLQGDYAQAIDYYTQILKISEKTGDKKVVSGSLNNIGVIYQEQGDYTKAIDYYTKSLKIIEETGDKEVAGASLNNIGNIYEYQGDYAKAIDYYTKSLKIEEETGDKQGLASSFNNIGNIYKYQGDYAKAIDYYTKSLKIREEIGDEKGVSGSLNNIGNIYENQGDYAKAIDYYTKSMKITEETGDKKGAAASLHNIGSIYQEQGDYTKAIDCYTKSLKIKEDIGDKQGVSNSLNNIGIVYKDQGDYAKAIDYYIQSLKIDEDIGDKKGMANSLCNIGNIYLEQGAYSQALKYSNRSLAIAKEVGTLYEIKQSASVLYKSYKQLGQFKESLEMYELYIESRDSLESEANQKEVIRQQYKYEYEKQAAADSVRAAEAAKVKDALLTAQRAENARQKQQAYYLYGGLALALLFGGFIFNRFRVTNKQKKVIEHQKTEVEHQRELADKQRKLAEEQKEVVEEKNKEIIDSINYAKRLQDAILPPLKVVKNYLQESFILYKPKDIVAGDFYWMETIKDTVYFAAADCTGHGVPGAMVSVVCSNALSKALIEENITDVGKLLDRTRELVVERFGRSEENIQDGMDLALCALNTKTNELNYAGANNPLWIIRKGASEVEETKADKQPIGKYDAEKPFTTHILQINQGDSLYIFSDGYPDQFGGDKGKKYKTGAMKKFLLSIQDKDMATQRQSLNEEFESWKGELEQIDDVCVIGVRI